MCGNIGDDEQNDSNNVDQTFASLFLCVDATHNLLMPGKYFVSICTMHISIKNLCTIYQLRLSYQRLSYHFNRHN